MDIATRYRPRVRAQGYLERERQREREEMAPEESEGESTDSHTLSNPRRAKFARTTPNTDADSATAFRKPSIPASASRPSVTPGNGNGNSNRRRSTLRENVRVPSGPRDLPASLGKRSGSHAYKGSGSPLANPSGLAFASDANARSFLTNANAAFPPAPADQPVHRFSFAHRAQQHASTLYSPHQPDSPATPAKRDPDDDAADFVPTMNFDDFQNSVTDPNWTSPLLSDFPTHSGGRALTSEPEPPQAPREGMSRSRDIQDGVSRSSSLRTRKLSTAPASVASGRNASMLQQAGTGQGQAASLAPSSQPNLSMRTRRQVDLPHSTTAPSLPTVGQPKAPRKSLGPGLATNVSSTDRNGNASAQASVANPPTPSADINHPHLKPALARTASLSNKSRRTTLLPSTSAGAQDLPRLSTATASTTSRAAKVRSMLPPARSASNNQPNETSHHNGEPDEAEQIGRATGGGKQQPAERNRAQTPSSSNLGSNRRQSTVSGRASGLGARTISPTDARRLKRMSMANAPPMPMPSANLAPASSVVSGSRTPAEEMQQDFWTKPELPRLAQPSPSLIPRKTSNTPSSARASPERQPFPFLPSSMGAWPAFLPAESGNGHGYVGSQARQGSLSSKSSYQSLLSRDNSTSRLPTLKPRSGSVHSISRGQEQYSGGGQDENEHVPPVPAIPKAYESPKESEHTQYFPPSTKPSSSAFAARVRSRGGTGDSGDLDDPTMLPPPSAPPVEHVTPRGSLEMSRPEAKRPTARNKSGEDGRDYKRISIFGNVATSSSASGATTVQSKPAGRPLQTDLPTGRRNNNLQPLRLPPLNLMPLSNVNTRDQTQQPKTPASLPHPTGELEQREGYSTTAQTPDHKRLAAKTPSTPLTASKATFWRRHDNDGAKDYRSASSNQALRDVTATAFGGGGGSSGEDVGMSTRFFFDDSSDPDTAGGILLGQGGGGKRRSGAVIAGRDDRGITPFASGSLPKRSAEFGGRGVGGGFAAGRVTDEYDLAGFTEQLPSRGARARADGGDGVVRPKTSSVLASAASPRGESAEPDSSMPLLPEVSSKKESAGAGLRRKLSLGWKRSSSGKAAEASESQGSPQSQIQAEPAGGEKVEREQRALEKTERTARIQKRRSEMPPPPPPGSAYTGETGQLGSGTASARPSVEAARRKSTLGASELPLQTNGEGEQPSQHPVAAKTRALHSEQGPQPVSSSAARSTRWANFAASATARSATRTATGPEPSLLSKHKSSPSTLSALHKDKDDLAADDEMKRLSQKRRDVDLAAKDSEALKARAAPRPKLSPSSCLHDRNCALNIFERGEVVDYEGDGVFFTGTRGAKKIIGALTSSSATATTASVASLLPDVATKKENYGYDDERGDYNIVVGDHLAYRYEVVDVLGKGSFGQVVRCVDHKLGGVVAVKIIRNKKRFHQQALVEVGILQRLGEWDPDGAHATLSITGSFYFRNHLCIVTPCLSINLYELIRAHNFAGFSLALIRRFARQLLVCLTLLHQKRIIHCDLKPENILLCDARHADVRVIDFGSSCREEEKVYTYIQSRFYRSPEVILGSAYGLGIDMWSLGCILAELWTGYPLFPGENEQEQFACIMELFGPPDRHLVDRCTRKKLFFDSVGKPRVTVSSKGRRRRPSSKTLAQALKTDDEAFVDFIARCLRWDPDRRLKPAEALSHPFIANLPLTSLVRAPGGGGIPDEARRAPNRVRSTAAPPTRAAVANASAAQIAAAASSSSSPVKRNAFAQQQQQQQQNRLVTPVKDRPRGAPSSLAPETPQTALRSYHGGGQAQCGSSPAKVAAQRRQSSVPGIPPPLPSLSAGGGAAIAGPGGCRRVGAVGSGNGNGGAGTGASGAGSRAPASQTGVNLAALAAKESMGAASSAASGSGSGAAGTGSGRWRA